MKSLSPTVAPRCQHTVAIALLLRTPAVVVVGGLVGDLFVPHVSNPSSDEPIKIEWMTKNVQLLKVYTFEV